MATINLADVLSDQYAPISQTRDAVVSILRDSDWVQSHPEDSPLALAVEGLSAAQDIDEFDAWFNQINDTAEVQGVWIDTV
ncbi:MAG TPA: hypothetical protein VK054_05480 [Beutenbergiaceae bacterium]|nr:hypothetical protein [Beutenbergiaceae bacterium]